MAGAIRKLQVLHVNDRGRLSRQWTDLVAYVLLPGLSVMLPAKISRRMLCRASGWGWLLSNDAGQACALAGKHVEIADLQRWKRRWKQVELVDVRDLYLLLFGRAGAVAQEVDGLDDLALCRDRVMVGMHWGPAISILKILSLAGLRPAFPYRLPEPELLRMRPFYYLFCRLATVYLKRTLAERAVAVGGAGRVLQSMLNEPGSICVLMDAPPMAGRPSIRAPVLGTVAAFNAGFPSMLAERRKEYVLYAMTLAEDGSLRKKLELDGPFRAENLQEFLDQYAAFLDRHLAADSPQWRIWRAEHQFWGRPDEAAATDSGLYQ
ncbi:MAG: hypothetical protein HKN57_12050 [Xanthomonadales bacterium]|nr:hypothetical protein [Xanthomonadales bacterium]